MSTVFCLHLCLGDVGQSFDIDASQLPPLCRRLNVIPVRRGERIAHLQCARIGRINAYVICKCLQRRPFVENRNVGSEMSHTAHVTDSYVSSQAETEPRVT